jgi:hypothetical protein
MPRRVLGGHRYRWDLSEIHASPGGRESVTSTRSENSELSVGRDPFLKFLHLENPDRLIVESPKRNPGIRGLFCRQVDRSRS